MREAGYRQPHTYTNSYIYIYIYICVYTYKNPEKSRPTSTLRLRCGSELWQYCFLKSKYHFRLLWVTVCGGGSTSHVDCGLSQPEYAVTIVFRSTEVLVAGSGLECRKVRGPVKNAQKQRTRKHLQERKVAAEEFCGCHTTFTRYTSRLAARNSTRHSLRGTHTQSSLKQ